MEIKEINNRLSKVTRYTLIFGIASLFAGFLVKFIQHSTNFYDETFRISFTLIYSLIIANKFYYYTWK